MALKLVTELIGEHTASGTDTNGRTHKLGSSKAPGQYNKVGSTKRILQFIGLTAGSNIIDIEASLDGGTTWATWAAGVSTDTFLIEDDGPQEIRTNVTTYNSGTIQVWCQKVLDE